MPGNRLRTTHRKAFGPAAVSAAASVWTPAAGRILRLQGGEIGAGASGIIHLLDGTAALAGTIATVQILANAPSTFELGDAGRLTTGAASPLQAKADSGTIGTVTMSLYGREERF